MLFSTCHAGTEDDADRGSLHSTFCSSCTQSCVFSFGLGRPMSPVGSIVIQTSAVSTMAGCDADDDKWSFLLIRLKNPGTEQDVKTIAISFFNNWCNNHVKKELLPHLFFWKSYILNHGYQMKGNLMKTHCYTATFWTFYWNP